MSPSTPEQRLAAAGHRLPAPPRPRGDYAPFHLQPLPGGGRQLTISGQTCRIDGMAIVGRCMPGDSLEPARAAARVAMLNVLAAVQSACGGALPAELSVNRLRGFVRCSDDFTAHTAVLDAASQVLSTAWPDAPRPARTAVGVPGLPDGAFIELELDALLP
ncbi:RidA family protein [Xylophilus rhododendri]|uniref:RidA family protein n=1 Tax=Xylophilus rhododendri TaxID=2697032 RepID=A0A857J5E8_9BURK|nr:RidA family protein [Xylophilus rhododendri]QHI98443.1 RidA family protein [Xylophilus rhododendri]